jgi:hypothetical protein
LSGGTDGVVKVTLGINDEIWNVRTGECIVNVALKEGSVAIRGMTLSSIVQIIQHSKKVHQFFIVKSQHVYLINEQGKVIMFTFYL